MAQEDTTDSKLHPVVLCGGSGTRLWPMSRESYPKQLLSLTSERSLLQETIQRVRPDGRFAAPLMVCNSDHRFIVAEQLRGISIAPRDIVLEPIGRNTAPAIAVAALLLSRDDPDALMLVLPSDHTIASTAAFHAAVDIAAAAARDGALVTFGIRPDHPETGYGYIQRGGPAGRPGCYAVQRFVEKPDMATARDYIADGGYDWNSGMFLFSASQYLEALGRMKPQMLAGCRAALDGASRDLDFMRLAHEPFAALAGESIDYAVMERAENVAVVPVDIGWNDIGSWKALWELANRDQEGNALVGDVVAVDTQNCYLRSEGPLVAALGLSDVAIIATEDAILALPKDRAQDVRAVVDALKAAGRTEPLSHPRVYRPWGFFQTVHTGDRFQVKRITVSPGAALSLQMHYHRAEHWIVVNGIAQVQRGNDELILNENESVYIPPHTRHRLVNPGKVPLNLIEVQSGAYLGEDDIVRYEDVYGRG